MNRNNNRFLRHLQPLQCNETSCVIDLDYTLLAVSVAYFFSQVSMFVAGLPRNVGDHQSGTKEVRARPESENSMP